MGIMKVVQLTTRDLFVSKLLDESLRSAVLQAVVIQTAKQAFRSTGGKPDATSITRDITQYIRDLLLERNISEEEVEKVLHPIPFFVSSSLGRVIKEEEEAGKALDGSDPASRSDEKKERRKSDGQSRRKSTLSSSSSLARTRASTSALPPTSSSSGTSPSLKSDSKPKRTRSQTHTAASLSSPSSTPQAQQQQQQKGASEKALKKSSSKQQRARSATSQSLIRKELEDDISPMENGQSA
jgi:hypothetical protein